MKKMFLLVPILSLLISCSKDVVETNYLPGKWSLISTELYENDSLKAHTYNEEVNTIYYFFDCETSSSATCDMYIEEDGEQQAFTYVYNADQNSIVLNAESIFRVDRLNVNQLNLSRTYGHFRSTYAFIKQN